MTLRRRSDRPNRTGHKWAAWDDETVFPDPATDPLRQTPEYRALVGEVARQSYGVCKARLYGCTGQAFDPHHVYPTSEGGPVLCPPFWLVMVCRSCHAKIHGSERDDAERRGLIVPKDRKPV